MSPQFVDWNADGNIDIVAGTFSGSPWVALGDGAGWHQPKMILDRDGERILLNQFWNYETKKWDETHRCDPEGGAPVNGHGTSAWAMDWEGDGDLDLLLGDYDGGYLYLRRNDGTATAPAFGKKNALVAADGKPIHVGKVSTMRLVDWNGDGTEDLLLGSMGDSYGDGAGGGVFAFANATRNLVPQYGTQQTWIAPSSKGATEPTRPDSGLYMDVADHDGDGDLDLIVGGYSMWTPPTPKLTDEQQQRVTALQTALDELAERSRALNRRLTDATESLPEAERDAARKEILEDQAAERREIATKSRSMREEIEPLTPGKKRRSFVWLYENLTIQPAGPTGGNER